MNKKAVVFTFITVILITLLIASFLVNISNRAQRDIQKTNLKVGALSSFVNSLNNELLQEVLRSSSNQVFLAFLANIESNNQYIQGDMDVVFPEALMNGYYNNEELKVMFQNNLNYTLGKSLDELKTLAQDHGAVFSYTAINKNNIKVSQEDPWNLNISFVINYNLNDSRNDVSWNIENKKISILLDIENYRDPFYLFEDQLNKTITKTNVTTWTLSEFNMHIVNSLFRNHADAPSFLKRLQGDKTSDANGIESILDSRIYGNGEFSNVDFEFWSNKNGECRVTGMPSNFRLTAAHLTYYEQTGTCS